jgi:hypothetical protein
MNINDLLIIAIEFSIGLAGFAGVIAAVRGRPEEWRDLDRYRLGNLLSMSFTASAGCFLALYFLTCSSSRSFRSLGRYAEKLLHAP